MRALATDLKMMARCVALSRIGGEKGEYPFGSVVAHNDFIVGEATNAVNQDADESRHAEIVAIANARRFVSADTLRECTVYSTVEPCPVCSFAIRMAGVRRVVFALHSPIMGGLSRWDILKSRSATCTLTLLCGDAPEIVTGVLANEALRAWTDWRPVTARIMIGLGFFVNGSKTRQANQRLLGAALGFVKRHTKDS